MQHTTLRFRCAACGSNQFLVPDNFKAGDMAACLGCGAEISFDDAEAAVIGQAKDYVADVFRDVFGKT